MLQYPRIGLLVLAAVVPLAFSQSATAQSGATILYFQSEQCPPCRQMEPMLVELHQRGWNVQSVDAPNQLDVARQYKIQNLPTLVLLSDGRETDRIVGVVSKEQLHDRLGRLAARSGKTDLPASGPSQPSDSTPPPRPEPIVRGQSPVAMAGFPMLQSGMAMGTSASTVNPTAANVAPATLSRDLGVSANSPNLSAQQIAERCMAATVRIRVEESNTTAFGTGTIVATHDQEALVLTCGHLFRDMVPGSQLKVELFAGTPRETTVLGQVIDFKADKEDIGLVAIQLPQPIEPVEVLPQGDVATVGQPAFSIGCDHGANPTRIDTRITHVNRYLGPANIEIEGAPAVGRSGGGLFDAQGRLIGVCNAACNEDNEGIYAAADVIYQQLARVDHSHLFVKKSSPTPVHTASAPMESSGLGRTQHHELDVSNEVAGVKERSEVELICVLRQQDGSERVVTITKPSESLLEQIRVASGKR